MYSSIYKSDGAAAGDRDCHDDFSICADSLYRSAGIWDMDMPEEREMYETEQKENKNKKENRRMDSESLGMHHL